MSEIVVPLPSHIQAGDFTLTVVSAPVTDFCYIHSPVVRLRPRSRIFLPYQQIVLPPDVLVAGGQRLELESRRIFVFANEPTH